MSLPTRWREDGSEATTELRELMRDAERQVPDAAQVEALTASVLAQLAPPPASVGDATAAPTGVAAGSGAKLLVLTMLTVVGTTSWWALRDAAPTAKTTRSARHSVELAPASPSAPSTTPPPAEIERRPSPAKAARSSSVTPPGGPRASLTPSRSTAPAHDSASELELLHAARITRRYAPREALEVLRRHEHDFPNSDLREEREALIIELLQFLDPREAARRLGAFELSYPQSPYRQSLRDAP